MKPSKNSNAVANFASLEIDGENITILPPKKKKEERGKNQVNAKKRPKLGRSQKRKLKKIHEEKVKELLMSKSIETLEKYKMREDVYSLMWSSRNLGQVETVREKRRREVEFSKAGLELPEADKPFSKRQNGNAFSSIEAEDKTGSPTIDVQTISIDDEANDTIQQSIPESSQKLTYPIQNEEIIVPMDMTDGDSKDNLYRENNVGKCSLERNVVAPTVVHVSRPKDVEKQRMGLPIVMMEQEIMEAINENTSVIICGETGCGKTTQVPQFLYEASFGSSHLNARGGIIGVTQPRRVAVLATAKRVAFELGLRLGKEVGFQVRHDRRVGKNCSIKFMTDGILLREVQSDFLLKRYSVIILDEAHERSLNTDILIGMLSRVIQQRQREYEEQEKRILSGETIEYQDRVYPLRLVLMSATLRVEDFVSEDLFIFLLKHLVLPPNYPSKTAKNQKRRLEAVAWAEMEV